MYIPVEDEEPQMQMSSMIDMVFLLIIFFMTASHMISETNKQLDIPDASHGILKKEKPDRWTVNVMSDGTVFSGGADTPIEIDDLRQQVAASVQANPDLKVYLRADRTTPHKTVRQVMNAMAEAGVGDFIFGVNSPGAEMED